MEDKWIWKRFVFICVGRLLGCVLIEQVRSKQLDHLTWCHVTSTDHSHQDLETAVVTKIQQQSFEVAQALFSVSELP